MFIFCFVMSYQGLQELLQAYKPEDPTEKEDWKKFLKFLLETPDGFQRCPQGHFTGSCWLENFDGSACLLTLHKKFNRWLPLGGHADGDDDLLRVSLKEAKEESGLTEIYPVSRHIFHIGAFVVPEYKGLPEHVHYDLCFYLKAFYDEPLVISAESNDLQWVRRDEPEKIPKEEAIQKMYQKWINWKGEKESLESKINEVHREQ